MASNAELPFNAYIITALMVVQPNEARDPVLFAKEVMEFFFKTDCALAPYDKQGMLRHLNDYMTDDMTDYELIQQYMEVIHYDYEDIIDEMMAERESKGEFESDDEEDEEEDEEDDEDDEEEEDVLARAQ